MTILKVRLLSRLVSRCKPLGVLVQEGEFQVTHERGHVVHQSENAAYRLARVVGSSDDVTAVDASIKGRPSNATLMAVIINVL